MPRERRTPQQPLGLRLRELRQSRRLSMRALAQAAGISAGYVQQLEVGLDPRTGRPIRPGPDVLRRLAGPLGTTYEALMAAAGYLPVTDEMGADRGRRSLLTIEEFREIHDLVFETTLDLLRERGLLREDGEA